MGRPLLFLIALALCLTSAVAIQNATAEESSPIVYTNPVVHLTDENFDGHVINSNEIWIVKFGAPWCKHCKLFDPKFAQAAETLGIKVRFGTVDAAAESGLARRFAIRKLPTIKYFMAGYGKTDKKAGHWRGQREASDMIRLGKALYDHLEKYRPYYKMELDTPSTPSVTATTTTTKTTASTTATTTTTTTATTTATTTQTQPAKPPSTQAKTQSDQSSATSSPKAKASSTQTDKTATTTTSKTQDDKSVARAAAKPEAKAAPAPSPAPTPAKAPASTEKAEPVSAVSKKVTQ